MRASKLKRWSTDESRSRAFFRIFRNVIADASTDVCAPFVITLSVCTAHSLLMWSVWTVVLFLLVVLCFCFICIDLANASIVKHPSTQSHRLTHKMWHSPLYRESCRSHNFPFYMCMYIFRPGLVCQVSSRFICWPLNHRWLLPVLLYILPRM